MKTGLLLPECLRSGWTHPKRGDSSRHVNSNPEQILFLKTGLDKKVSTATWTPDMCADNKVRRLFSTPSREARRIGSLGHATGVRPSPHSAQALSSPQACSWGRGGSLSEANRRILTRAMERIFYIFLFFPSIYTHF